MTSLVKAETGEKVFFETEEGAERTLKAFPKKYARSKSVAVGKKNIEAEAEAEAGEKE